MILRAIVLSIDRGPGCRLSFLSFFLFASAPYSTWSGEEEKSSSSVRRRGHALDDRSSPSWHKHHTRTRRWLTSVFARQAPDVILMILTATVRWRGSPRRLWEEIIIQFATLFCVFPFRLVFLSLRALTMSGGAI